MGRIGFFEILFIICVIILLFGVKRLPEIGRTIGKALKQFRSAAKEMDDENNDGQSAEEKKEI